MFNKTQMSKIIKGKKMSFYMKILDIIFQNLKLYLQR